MKDPCPASYSFVGRDPGAFFSQEVISRINQPTDKSVAQVTHSLPLAQMKENGMNQTNQVAFCLIDSGRSEANFNQGRGGNLFLTLSHPIPN